MQLKDLGEFPLIDRIARRNSHHPKPKSVILPIGDDAAILRPNPTEDIAITTDAAVENIHFRWSTSPPRFVARRALAAALSDLAAMGARPLGFTFALAAPPDLEVRVLDGLTIGLLREAETHACPLVGGNLTRASETSITLTVLGAVARGRALTRRGAAPGDTLYVTGTLGGAALEVALAERGQGRVKRVPVPRLAAGRALGRCKETGGCIDISDGLEADLDHLVADTPVRAELDLAQLPFPDRFRASCTRAGLDPEQLALTGGEDYELLFTIHPGGPSGPALSRRLGVRVSAIGRIVAGRRVSRTRPGRTRGHRHF